MFLNIAGSGFYSGAAYFSSISALKVGCGKSTLASTGEVLNAVAALCPDIILLPLNEHGETKEKTISSKALKKLEQVLGNYDVVSVGCGLSTNKETVRFFEGLMKIWSNLKLPLLLMRTDLTYYPKCICLCHQI